jgi:hypothetical protein
MIDSEILEALCIEGKIISLGFYIAENNILVTGDVHVSNVMDFADRIMVAPVQIVIILWLIFCIALEK